MPARTLRMNISKCWTLQYVLLAFLLDPIIIAKGEDFVDAEKSLHHYHEYKNSDTNLLEWKWSLVPFCKAIFVHPERIEITLAWIEKREIMLESINCTKIEVELLNCAGQGRNLTPLFLGWSAVFLSGPHGEIYEMYPPSEKTKCNDPHTLTIRRAIVRGGNMPRLWGVGEIFQEIIAQKSSMYVSDSGRRIRKTTRPSK